MYIVRYLNVVWVFLLANVWIWWIHNTVNQILNDYIPEKNSILNMFDFKTCGTLKSTAKKEVFQHEHMLILIVPNLIEHQLFCVPLQRLPNLFIALKARKCIQLLKNCWHKKLLLIIINRAIHIFIAFARGDKLSRLI